MEKIPTSAYMMKRSRENKIRILYVFTRPVGEYVNKVKSGLVPQELYGLFSIPKFGIEPFYSDRVFTLKGLPYIFAQLLQRGVTIPITKMGFRIDQAIKLLPYIKDADVVFTTTDSCGLPLLLLKQLGIFNKPIVYQTIGLYDNYLRYNRRGTLLKLYKRLLAFADKIITYSAKERERLLSILQVPSNRIEAIQLGVDAGYFHPKYNLGEEYIISIGRNPHRDYKTLFKVAEEIMLPCFVVCSPRNLKGLQIPNNCDVLFNIPISKVRDLLAKARLCVVPTYATAYPSGQTVVLQAMSMGKPVITTDKEWLSEYGIENYVHCVKVPPESPETLKQAVIQLWNDYHLRQHLSRNARMLVETRLSIDHFGARLAKVLNEVFQNAN